VAMLLHHLLQHQLLQQKMFQYHNLIHPLRLQVVVVYHPVLHFLIRNGFLKQNKNEIKFFIFQ
jgi:hypothetical protein